MLIVLQVFGHEPKYCNVGLKKELKEKSEKLDNHSGLSSGDHECTMVQCCANLLRYFSKCVNQLMTLEKG